MVNVNEGHDKHRIPPTKAQNEETNDTAKQFANRAERKRDNELQWHLSRVVLHTPPPRPFLYYQGCATSPVCVCVCF